jgi:hypothetical protein
VRRALVVAALAILCGAFDLAAQPAARIARVGYLSANSPATDRWRPAFVDGLREHGYVEGQNLAVESRFADRDASSGCPRWPRTSSA